VEEWSPYSCEEVAGASSLSPLARKTSPCSSCTYSSPFLRRQKVFFFGWFAFFLGGFFSFAARKLFEIRRVERGIPHLSRSAAALSHPARTTTVKSRSLQLAELVFFQKPRTDRSAPGLRPSVSTFFFASAFFRCGWFPGRYSAFLSAPSADRMTSLTSRAPPYDRCPTAFR